MGAGKAPAHGLNNSSLKSLYTRVRCSRYGTRYGRGSTKHNHSWYLVRRGPAPPPAPALALCLDSSRGRGACRGRPRLYSSCPLALPRRERRLRGARPQAHSRPRNPGWRCDTQPSASSASSSLNAFSLSLAVPSSPLSPLATARSDAPAMDARRSRSRNSSADRSADPADGWWSTAGGVTKRLSIASTIPPLPPAPLAEAVSARSRAARSRSLASL